ncbi:hypothetical protein ES705_33814 [subsurface metagenome]
MAKVYTKKTLEKAHHLPIGRILYYLYWTQHKNWKEVALELDVPQRTVERWAEESGIESRSYAHEMMLPTKTVAEIEEEYGKPLNEVLFYLTLNVAARGPAVKPEEIKKLPSVLYTFVAASTKQTVAERTSSIPSKRVIVKVEMAPTQGIRKCHNCLEEIKLSKNGLGKKYQAVTRAGKWIFWHLPGQCTGDPNAHANLLHEDRPSLDSPGRFWVMKGRKD